MTTAVDHLNAALDAVDADIARLVATRDDLAALVEQLRDPSAPAVRSSTSTSTRQAARTAGAEPAPPAPAPTKARQVACPDCGELLPNRNAVDTHRRDRHPSSAAKPAARKPASKTTAPRSNKPSVDYAEVAEAMRRIRASGKPLQVTLAEEYDVPLTTVKNWITKVYKMGLDEPGTDSSGAPWDLPARRSIDHEADTVYRCVDCGDERATLDGLTEHTYANHQRPTKVAEQMAVRPTASAA